MIHTECVAVRLTGNNKEGNKGTVNSYNHQLRLSNVSASKERKAILAVMKLQRGEFILYSYVASAGTLTTRDPLLTLLSG